MDNKRSTAQSTLCMDNKKDKTELKAVTDIKKKLQFHGFRFKSAILRIPRSRKITGPINNRPMQHLKINLVFSKFLWSASLECLFVNSPTQPLTNPCTTLLTQLPNHQITGFLSIPADLLVQDTSVFHKTPG